MSILIVNDLCHSYGDKLIFKNACIQLATNDKIGLVGKNGSGKSTFLNILTGCVIPDSGTLRWANRTTYGYLDQYATLDDSLTIREYLQGAFAHLYEIERKLNALNAESVHAGKKRQIENARIAGNYQSQLEHLGFYDIPNKIGIAAEGLGFASLGMDRELGKLSGGQRVKVMLAKLLLEKPKVLLLDEPTNFLDEQHIEWLSKILREYDGSFIVVSHDHSFLNKVTNAICCIENYCITRFPGNYDAYTKLLAQREEEYKRRYDAQQKLIERTEDYIRKNITRASTSGMAKSRRKMLQRMDKLDKPTTSPKPTFKFKFKPLLTNTCLTVTDLEIGYYYAILPKFNFELYSGDKMVIRGCNGIGKSTFIKTIVGDIPQIKGKFRLGEGVVVNYIEQDYEWRDADATAFDIISDAYPAMLNKDIRTLLGSCGLRADLALQKVSSLSGGEQAKIKIALAVLKPCNMLILDEPTNHLDADTKACLLKSLKQFEGSVLIVCHEQAFYSQFTDNILDAERLFESGAAG